MLESCKGTNDGFFDGITEGVDVVTDGFEIWKGLGVENLSFNEPIALLLCTLILGFSISLSSKKLSPPKNFGSLNEKSLLTLEDDGGAGESL